MKEYVHKLSASPLFENIDEADITDICHNLGAKVYTYSKNALLWRAGEKVETLGFVLHGAVCVASRNFLGAKNILRTVPPGEYFGESHSLCDEKLFFDVESVENDTVVIFFRSEKILNFTEPSHIGMQIRKNFINILTLKATSLNSKVYLLSCRSIRDKVLSYLSFEAHKQGSDTITLPFNRQEMADYLSVDRVALSKELAKLKHEKKIEYYKTDFTLLR